MLRKALGIAAVFSFVMLAACSEPFFEPSSPPPIEETKQGGFTISLSAYDNPIESVSDGGTLSYEWFRNTTDSNSGGTSVSTASSFTPPTIPGGAAYYYAEVTNTKTGSSSSIKTRPVKVSVNNGKGTVEDPFLVHDVVSLQKVGSGTDGWSLSAHYRQTADIDLASVPNWTPIGTDTASFTGIYDGDGKTISNLTINAPTEDNQGLFCMIYGLAVIKNIGLVNCTL